MQFSEKEVEDLIFNDVKQNLGVTLSLRGLDLPFRRALRDGYYFKVYRQLNIDPYGIIDIAIFYRSHGMLIVDLLELKAVPLRADDFNQIFRYKKGLEVYTKQTFQSVDLQVNCFLIGPSYDNGCYIQNESNIAVSEYSYDLDGFSFKTHSALTTDWAIKNDDHCTFRKVKPKPLVRLKNW